MEEYILKMTRVKGETTNGLSVESTARHETMGEIFCSSVKEQINEIPS